jgi:hypothetical protein
MQTPLKLRRIATFVVRLWKEPSTGDGPWRGQVTHLQSGEVRYFAELDRALAFIQDHLGEDDRSPCAGQDNQPASTRGSPNH